MHALHGKIEPQDHLLEEQEKRRKSELFEEADDMQRAGKDLKNAVKVCCKEREKEKHIIHKKADRGVPLCSVPEASR